MATDCVRAPRKKALDSLPRVEAAPPSTPIRAKHWTTWERIGEAIDSPTDREWELERRGFGASGIDDPWTR